MKHTWFAPLKFSVIASTALFTCSAAYAQFIVIDPVAIVNQKVQNKTIHHVKDINHTMKNTLTTPNEKTNKHQVVSHVKAHSARGNTNNDVVASSAKTMSTPNKTPYKNKVALDNTKVKYGNSYATAATVSTKDTYSSDDQKASHAVGELTTGPKNSVAAIPDNLTKGNMSPATVGYQVYSNKAKVHQSSQAMPHHDAYHGRTAQGGGSSKAQTNNANVNNYTTGAASGTLAQGTIVQKMSSTQNAIVGTNQQFSGINDKAHGLNMHISNIGQMGSTTMNQTYGATLQHQARVSPTNSNKKSAG